LPTISAPTSAVTVVNTDLVFHTISIADVDLGNGELAVTLTTTHGTLSLGGTTGLSSLSGNNSAAVVFTGTRVAVNAALNGLTFHPAFGYSGPANVDIRADDQGHSGAPDPSAPAPAFRSVAVTVTATLIPTITDVQIGPVVAGLTNQRSRIDRIVVSFNSPITVRPDAAFGLVRNGTEVVPTTVAWSTDFAKATLTFAGPNVGGGSLTDGRYRLMIDGSQLITAGGQPVDADGDGLPGGLLTANFHRLFGDVDGDGDTDFTDLAQFRLALGGPSTTPFIAYNPAFDSDGDGDVDFTDLAQFRLRLGTVLPP
jgi:hypothetical protein